MWSIYVFVNGFVSIALLAVLAVCTGVPFVFPSLGPTAYLLFFSPRAEASSPRNTILGHAIGLACGYGAFELLGKPLAAAVGHGGFDWPRVIAAALSLAATGALMVLFKAGHPPAGATTLIVSLGIIYKPWHLVVVMIAVVILTIQAWCINRLPVFRFLFGRLASPRTVRLRRLRRQHNSASDAAGCVGLPRFSFHFVQPVQQPLLGLTQALAADRYRRRSELWLLADLIMRVPGVLIGCRRTKAEMKRDE